MKLSKIYPLLALCLIVSLTGCAAIEAIFKAGVWTGILMVALLIGLLIFVVRMFIGRK
ncbi:phosphatidate cytidylyltransferase [Solitalea longa]|uniref:Phosphatidate cytidylyltransferase n=1 Tax=Solitalea longa TaxID=2079460 RepID=A0A2S5A0B7_9SPHI|nr:phosphatidate cytidylyltransferase [Solitalea longa]POY35984.1 phosphatidate cytidylyltransferase [Solitalea longa]